jgi:hypothetical protein
MKSFGNVKLKKILIIFLMKLLIIIIYIIVFQDYLYIVKRNSTGESNLLRLLQKTIYFNYSNIDNTEIIATINQTLDTRFYHTIHIDSGIYLDKYNVHYCRIDKTMSTVMQVEN